jgi:nicotinamidase/pyrazinamidase
MLNDFVNPKGALYFKAGEDIIPKVNEIMDKFVSECSRTEPVFKGIFLCEYHTENDLEFKKFPRHGVKETWGAEIDERIRKIDPFHSREIHKTRYGGFFETDLENELKDIDEIWVVGVCTDICVLFTVEELCNRDKRVKIFKDAVASFDPKRHEFALDLMKNVLGAEIC